MKIADSFQIDLILPAFFEHEAKGSLFNFKLEFLPGKNNQFKANDHLSQKLLAEIERVIMVLYRMNINWRLLQGTFILKSEYSGFAAGDTSSAGLGIAISLFNLVRHINGAQQAADVIGTGFVRWSGHIDNVDGIDYKRKAILNSSRRNFELLTHEDIFHLSLLEKTIGRYIP